MHTTQTADPNTAEVRPNGDSKRTGRIVIRILCIALIVFSVLSLLFLPAVKLTGEGTERYLSDMHSRIAESFDVAQDVLLHSDAFDRNAIIAAGIHLDESSVLPLLARVEASVVRVTNGSLSPVDLLHASTMLQRLLPIADRLFSTEAAAGLFDALGIANLYTSSRALCTLYRQYATIGLLAYEALLGLIVLCAIGSILLTLFGKRKVLDILLLIAECLLTLLFVGMVIGGNLFSAQIGLSAAPQMSFTFLPIGSVAAVIVVLILKARLRKMR